jgi:hypothetical protein
VPAFISLLLRREEGILPGIPAEPNKLGGTMRLDQLFDE